jgi:dihydrofolate reductase
MSKVKLFIAASLDGKIARPDGSVSWLEEYPNPEGLDYGYTDFYASIGTVVMGRKTYEEILGYDVPWPYPDAQTYVVTSNADLAISSPKTKLLHKIDEADVRRLASETEGDLWLVGGGEIISAFLKAGLVDEITLTVIPRILGAGIPLFPDGCPETHFNVKSAEAFSSGFVNLVYTPKNS